MMQGMASLSTYINKFGPCEGRKRCNAFFRKYKRRNRERINAARRRARKAHKQRENRVTGLSPARLEAGLRHAKVNDS
jgi:hypothetical protein